MKIQSVHLLRFSTQLTKFYARCFAPLAEEFALSMREIDVLLFLANNPGYDTARDITEFRGISKSQVSQAVDLLTAEGFLQRTQDSADRRIVHLSITPAGAPLAARAQVIQSACIRQLLSGITPEQEDALQNILELILKNGSRLAEEESV